MSIPMNENDPEGWFGFMWSDVTYDEALGAFQIDDGSFGSFMGEAIVFDASTSSFLFLDPELACAQLQAIAIASMQDTQDTITDMSAMHPPDYGDKWADLGTRLGIGAAELEQWNDALSSCGCGDISGWDVITGG